MVIWRIFLFILGASHKLALLEGLKFEFISGGEDGLMIHIDIRQPKPNELAIQKSEKNERPVPIYRYYYNIQPTHYAPEIFKCEVKAAWCGNFTTLLPFKFNVKSNFGELKQSSMWFLAILEGQNFYFW